MFLLEHLVNSKIRTMDPDIYGAANLSYTLWAKVPMGEVHTSGLPSCWVAAPGLSLCLSVATSALCDVNTGVFDLTECAPTWEKNSFKYLPKLYIPLNQLGAFFTLSVVSIQNCVTCSLDLLESHTPSKRPTIAMEPFHRKMAHWKYVHPISGASQAPKNFLTGPWTRIQNSHCPKLFPS